MTSNLPEKWIRSGWIQKMDAFFNLSMENPRPTVNTKGSEGGTIIVIISIAAKSVAPNDNPREIPLNKRRQKARAATPDRIVKY